MARFIQSCYLLNDMKKIIGPMIIIQITATAFNERMERKEQIILFFIVFNVTRIDRTSNMSNNEEKEITRQCDSSP